MGNLPIERITPSRPFNTCGVDLCGPFLIKLPYQRRTSAQQIYVASFVCFVTKAVHFELVSDLSADNFIACLKRFIYRRGKCNTIWSDNATNFHGSNNELQKMYNLYKNENFDSINKYCVNEQITWKFIPPRSPNFGGFWEASIKSFKFHLKKVIGNTILTYEEFNTLIIHIEGILNSRPLTVLSSDPNDPEPLTPAHFLTGGPIVALVEQSSQESLSYLTKWKRVYHMSECFWKRFSVEYLNSLQQRSKWRSSVPNIRDGDVVLMNDENKQSTQWLLGKIVKTFTGTDGRIRVVEVLTKAGIYKRPVSKICKLPIT